jgi:carbohydrate-selective porin OprB
VTAGGAFLKPLGVRGELGLGFVWMQPGPNPLLGTPDPRDQYGLETYWKLLVTPDLWVTPGVQFIINPSRNFSTDFVAIPQLKFRLFF